MQTHTAAVGAQPGSGCWRGGRQLPPPPNDAHQHRPLRGTPWAQPGRSQTGAASRGGGGVRGLRREQLSAGGTRGSVPAAGDGWAKGLGAPRGWAASAPWGGRTGGTQRGGGAGGLGLLGCSRRCAPTAESRIPHPAWLRSHSARPAIRCPPYGQRGMEGGEREGGGCAPAAPTAPEHGDAAHGGSGTEEPLVLASLPLFICAADISCRPRARATRPRCGSDPQVSPPNPPTALPHTQSGARGAAGPLLLPSIHPWVRGVGSPLL